jgi:streptomycin 6-kinase
MASLLDMVLSGQDDEASRIICHTVAQLHAPRDRPLPDLIPLSPQDIVVLYGDIHHGNILDFGPRSWLAIDPERRAWLRYANLFCNPELATVTAPGPLARQLAVAIEAAGLERRRLLQWILAYAGLSAAWVS